MRAINIEEFRKKLSIINDIIYFDENNYLREKTTNSNEIKKLIFHAKLLLKENNGEDKYFLYGVLGNLNRLVGEPKKAIKYLNYCLTESVEKRKPQNEIVSLIRLGEANKYDGNYKESLKCFNTAMNKCKEEKINEYMDFVLQHKGKCMMELYRLTEAEECFNRALEIRKKKGDQSLISSTEKAIKMVCEMKK